MSQRKNTEIRTMIVVAKVISTLFRPVYYPLVCFVLLFNVTFLRKHSVSYKLMELAILAMFTIALPYLLTLLYRRLRHLDRQQLRLRQNRIVPYAIYMGCYLLYIGYYLICLSMLGKPHIHIVLLAVIVVSIIIQAVCTLISLWWKVSIHAAGAGAVIGAIMAYGNPYLYNPSSVRLDYAIPWLCIAIIVAGMVGTSRMILRQHGLSQILVGTLIGILCGYFGTLLTWETPSLLSLLVS